MLVPGGGPCPSGGCNLTVENTIIANNTGAASGNCFVISRGDGGSNIEFPGTTCGFTLGSDRRADPLLGPLANNGGVTLTHAVTGGPAIGGGYRCNGTDQRGVPRHPEQGCTIGAFEFWRTNIIRAPSNFDGDTASDITVYRPSSGTWYVLQSLANYTTYAAYQWGAAADMPVPGDYDGDGATDLAVYRPSTGTWYVLQSSGGQAPYLITQWGTMSDIPVPGDYDADRKTDIAFFRPSTGEWFVLKSGSVYTASNTYVWGTGTDIPVLQRR